MKFLQQIALLAALILAYSIQAQAQSLPNKGQLGIRANVTGQSSIEVPYMLNEDFSLAPYLGFNSVEDQSTTLMIGVRPRYYTGLASAVATYFTGTLGFSNTSISNTNSSITDFNLGVGYGAEYFFSDKFSTGADVNLNSRFGDNATSISTAARVSVSVYF